MSGKKEGDIESQKEKGIGNLLNVDVFGEKNG